MKVGHISDSTSIMARGRIRSNARRTHRPILVTQNGRAASFFVDVADFQRMREAIAIMDDVRAAEEEIERGETFSPEELRARLHAEREADSAVGMQP